MSVANVPTLIVNLPRGVSDSWTLKTVRAIIINVLQPRFLLLSLGTRVAE
jgi:hypothetical protein